MLKRFPFLVVVFAFAMAFGNTAVQANCRSLQLQLNMAVASRDTGEIQQVRRRMAQSGCQSGRRSAGSVWEPWAGLTRTPLPQRIRPEARRPRLASREARPDSGTRAPGGTFRTLCVRSCDGYYFPISFSTTRDRFEADQATCTQTCPAADAQIYYHPNAGSGPESMVSLAGSLYTDLPTAFSYRSDLNPSCSCGRPAISVAAVSGAAASSASIAPPAPRPRSAPGEDPETLANRAGRLQLRYSAPPLAAGEPDAPPGPVRVVGADDPNPVLVSPVPNDFDTSLLWNAPDPERR